MKKDCALSKRIGIVGGGQLGKMMIQEAKKMGFYVTILDPSQDCPAHSIADEHITADYEDAQAYRKLSEKSDIITYELEHINVEILIELENEGIEVYPTAESLMVIQDKFTQKEALAKGGIPVADFTKITDETSLINAGKKFGYPFLLKRLKGGYDGKGNIVINSVAESRRIAKEYKYELNSFLAERFVTFRKEISVLACRAINGEVKVYPVGENIHKNNILLETRVPAEINRETCEGAMRLAQKVMEIFKGVGMFCVEMFITDRGAVVVNEVAPRPHNSGHYTIEGCYTSQFEQHIRAITGLPLGNSALIFPTVMRNLLGEENYFGCAIVVGAEEALAVENARLHVYGKVLTVPSRKMGHITVTAPKLEDAVQKAEEAFSYVKVIGEKQAEDVGL